jgi:hypothetical protein
MINCGYEVAVAGDGSGCGSGKMLEIAVVLVLK